MSTVDRSQSPEADEPRYPQALVDVPLDDADEAAAFLFELGATAVEQRDEATLAKGASPGRATLVASFDDAPTARAAVEAIDVSWSPRLAELIGDAWRDEWKKHFVPFRLTSRLTIRPPWEPYTAAGADEKVLELEPGRAFGTGLHATTALVARTLESLEPRLRGCDVLDVGTGSGILALVAIALGAAKAVAIDVDPEAIAVTMENARRNRYEDRIEADTTPVGAVERTFDVVLANIEARVLIELAAAITPRVRPGGVLILSGILLGQESDVARAFESFTSIATPEQGEWVAMVLGRNPSRL